MNDTTPSNGNQSDVYDLPLLKRNIRTQTSDPTIKHLCERIDKGRLKPQADFQRKYVWKDNISLKSRLIESVFLEVPIPTIYTAEEDDGSEVVIDGQQRLLTFHSFLRNEFRLRGLVVCKELNHKSYKTLGDINELYQEKIDNYPLRIIKILKDSDASVRFDIFERLNRGSVKLNDQELRNCIYRGPFNDFLKNIVEDKDYQVLLGSKVHQRMQDVELALRFFVLYKLTYLNYKAPMKHFLNSFMKEHVNIEDEKLEGFRSVFKQAVSLTITVFGNHAFNLYTNKDEKSGKYEKVVNKGLFDVLLYGFTRYNQNQVMPYKDMLKEELFWLMTNNDEFLDSITGSGTDSRLKLDRKFYAWLSSLENIIGSPKNEKRCFSWDIKNQLWEKKPVCSLCEQRIESVDDAEVDHIEFYWRGGKTIAENARLAHRFCNRSRKLSKKTEDVILVKGDDPIIKIENEIRSKIHTFLSKNKDDYWESKIPVELKLKVSDRIRNELNKYPYKKEDLKLSENKLSFCDIRDYSKIIRSNWDFFENMFYSKTELNKHINNLSEYRNQVKHGRIVDTVAKKGGEAAIDWFSRILKLA
ncbi:HNH endonuclease family protein [Thermodesulfobacteriota bacterium]